MNKKLLSLALIGSFLLASVTPTQAISEYTIAKSLMGIGTLSAIGTVYLFAKKHPIIASGLLGITALSLYFANKCKHVATANWIKQTLNDFISGANSDQKIKNYNGCTIEINKNTGTQQIIISITKKSNIKREIYMTKTKNIDHIVKRAMHMIENEL